MLLQGKVPWQSPGWALGAQESPNPSPPHGQRGARAVPGHCFPLGEPREELGLSKEREGLKSFREEKGRGLDPTQVEAAAPPALGSAPHPITCNPALNNPTAPPEGPKSPQETPTTSPGNPRPQLPKRGRRKAHVGRMSTPRTDPTPPGVPGTATVTPPSPAGWGGAPGGAGTPLDPRHREFRAG